MKTSFMTVGFMFSEDLRKVALVTKNRPDWQAGHLNGIGGKVNEGESFLLAQIREFFEETGIIHFDWTHVGEITVKFQDPHNPVSANEANQVVFFAARTDKVFSVVTQEDEEVGVYDVGEILKQEGYPYFHGDIITNLRFLIPHAIDMLPPPVDPDDDLPF